MNRNQRLNASDNFAIAETHPELKEESCGFFGAFMRGQREPLTDAEKYWVGRTPLGPDDSGVGAALLPSGVTDDVFSYLPAYRAWARCRVIPLETRYMTLPGVSAGMSAGFVVTEGESISDDASLAGEANLLQTVPVAARKSVSRALLSGSPTVGRTVAEQLTSALSSRIEWAFAQGLGTDTTASGNAKGIFTDTAFYRHGRYRLGGGNGENESEFVRRKRFRGG